MIQEHTFQSTFIWINLLLKYCKCFYFIFLLVYPPSFYILSNLLPVATSLFTSSSSHTLLLWSILPSCLFTFLSHYWVDLLSSYMCRKCLHIKIISFVDCVSFLLSCSWICYILVVTFTFLSCWFEDTDSLCVILTLSNVKSHKGGYPECTGKNLTGWNHPV